MTDDYEWCEYYVQVRYKRGRREFTSAGLIRLDAPAWDEETGELSEEALEYCEFLHRDEDDGCEILEIEWIPADVYLDQHPADDEYVFGFNTNWDEDDWEQEIY